MRIPVEVDGIAVRSQRAFIADEVVVHVVTRFVARGSTNDITETLQHRRVVEGRRALQKLLVAGAFVKFFLREIAESLKVACLLILGNRAFHGRGCSRSTVVPVNAKRAAWNIQRVIDVVGPRKARIGGGRAGQPPLRGLPKRCRATKKKKRGGLLLP